MGFGKKQKRIDELKKAFEDVTKRYESLLNNPVANEHFRPFKYSSDSQAVGRIKREVGFTRKDGWTR